MKTDNEKLQKVYEKWSTEELLMAVTVNRDDYGPGALDIIDKELKKRNIDNQSKEEFQTNHLQKKQAVMNSGKLYCPKCYCSNIEKQKPFWAFFLLGPLVYLLIPKYQCWECGYQFRGGKIKKPDSRS